MSQTSAMENLLPWLERLTAWPFILGFAAVIALLMRSDVRRSVQRDRERADVRQEGYKREARSELGLELAPAARFPDLPAFDLLTRDAKSNLLAAKIGDVQIFLFEYDWSDETVQLQTVACVVGPRRRLPSFRLAPAPRRAIAGPIGTGVGRRQLEFDDAEFELHYAVYQYNPDGADADAIRRVLGPPARAYLAARPGLSLECMRDHLLVHRPSELIPPAAIADFLRDALRVYDLISQAARVA
jgi:hypothetical protein